MCIVNVLFGNTFVEVQVLSNFRIFQGIAAAASAVAGISILMCLFPDNIYQVISLTDAIFMVGYILGKQ